MSQNFPNIIKVPLIYYFKNTMTKKNDLFGGKNYVLPRRENKMSKKKECSRCKNTKKIDQFKSDAGKEFATCKRCRDLQKSNRCDYRVCLEENCSTQPSYGEKGCSKREYCSRHSPVGYINISHQQCHHENCTIVPNFGKPGSSKVEYCLTHKLHGYVNVKSKRCQYENCTTIPIFGKPGDNRAIYCSKHKSLGYVNVKNRRCHHENCTSRPSFGKSGSNKAIYCSNHKLLGYIDVKSKRCQHENCTTIPIFGKPGDNKAIYCSAHKLHGYIDVKNRRCQHENCTTVSIFGKPESNKAIYCSAHKLHGYIDVKNRRCQHENCTTGPIFGEPGSNKAIYCSEHKLHGYIDVKSRKCLHENCNTRANYNRPGYSSEYCAKHKTTRMLINPLKYGKDDVKECTYCLAKIHYYEDYCHSCKQFNILGQTVKTHAKELEIKVLLEEKFDSAIFNHDKTVSGGCSRKRPDFLLTAKWGNIVLEVDEFQHKRKTYPCTCEISRMKEIYFDCGVENLLFIRYNPDNYKTVTYEKPIIKKKRQELLVKIISQQLETKEVENLGVMYLFYDHFSVDAIEIEHIEPYK